MSIVREAKDKISKILPLLEKEYPGAKTALRHDNSLQLLVATILSAQCTDKRVNMVTPILFGRYQTAKDFAASNINELETIIHSTGFYKNKAKNIRGCCRMLVEGFHGVVPDTMEKLVRLPGVGRKTANVILGSAFGKNEGVCVDTHVMRLSQRIGLSRHKDPIRIERDLMKITPQEEWTHITHYLIEHGRKICNARKPKCTECVIRIFCRYYMSTISRRPPTKNMTDGRMPEVESPVSVKSSIRSIRPA